MPGPRPLSPAPGPPGRLWFLEDTADRSGGGPFGWHPLAASSRTVGGHGWQAVVGPAGFITDFASAKVGRFYLLTHRSTYSVPSIFHDYLYLTAKVSRKQADIYFHQLLLRQGIN